MKVFKILTTLYISSFVIPFECDLINELNKKIINSFSKDGLNLKVIEDNLFPELLNSTSFLEI
jgi:hypothetical protein